MCGLNRRSGAAGLVAECVRLVDVWPKRVRASCRAVRWIGRSVMVVDVNESVVSFSTAAVCQLAVLRTVNCTYVPYCAACPSTVICIGNKRNPRPDTPHSTGMQLYGYDWPASPARSHVWLTLLIGPFPFGRGE